MGRDKALLPDPERTGHSLLERACGISRKALEIAGQSPQCVFISGTSPGAQVLLDRVLDRGPLAGMDSAVHFALDWAESLLFLPVDMPGLTPETLAALIESGVNYPAAHLVGSELPVLVRVTVETGELLSKMIRRAEEDTKAPSVREFLDRVGAVAVTAGSLLTGEMSNINTPLEYAAWSTGREW